MNRKIAAIFAADIAGYSKLVAEDEEETLRRLASYRSVMDDFIARAGGRIFNTAGDAVLADSAVARYDFDMALLASEIKDAEEDVADCTDDAERDKLARHLEQLKSLQAALAQ